MEACRKQHLLCWLRTFTYLVITFFYDLLQYLFIHLEVFAQSQSSVQPVHSRWANMQSTKKNIAKVKDGIQAFFHKLRSSAMLSVVSSKVLRSCRRSDLGIQIITLTSSPGRKESTFSSLVYSHLLCSTAERSRYNLLGLSFILWHKISQEADCFFG